MTLLFQECKCLSITAWHTAALILLLYIYNYMLLHYINTIVVQVVCQLQHGYTTLILLLYKLYKLMPDSMECVYVHKQMSLNRA